MRVRSGRCIADRRAIHEALGEAVTLTRGRTADVAEADMTDQHDQPALDDLLAQARTARDRAYAPYSNFLVGAAIRTEAGNVYTGVNVENVSYPVGVCAERNAIGAAILAEGPAMRLSAVAVSARGPDGRDAPCTPCGACRQAIAEFGDARVVFLDTEAAIRTVTIDALLPAGFTFLGAVD